MKKIPTLFERDPDTKYRYVTRTVHPDCRWVIDGEGWPTYKWDGTAVRIDTNGRAWKRRELRADFIDRSGERVTVEPPAEWWQEGEADPATGKRVGWVPVDPGDPSDQWHREALARAEVYTGDFTAGTYELVGPKVQGNPHGFAAHKLIPHGEHHMETVPTDFDELGRWLGLARDISWFSDSDGTMLMGFEGIVWHHPDGRMCKIKAKDFPA